MKKGETKTIWKDMLLIFMVLRFQQEDAPADTSLPATTWLRNRFENNIISYPSEFSWPAWSPGLSTLDYLLFGCQSEGLQIKTYMIL